MLLYDSKAGTNPKKVRIFLAEKGMSVERTFVDLAANGQDAPDYRAVNSLGLLPALKLDDGTVITESVAICRYFEAVQPAPALFGTNAREIALIDMWIRRIELEVFYPAIMAFKSDSAFFAGRGHPQNKDFADAMRAVAADKLRWLDGELADGRPYAAGEAFSMADIVAMACFAIHKGAGVTVPDDVTHYHAWRERLSARPSMAA